jgi:catechol 2,3-dioxygenase-like lactoylglutathione lyase family enzyme
MKRFHIHVAVKDLEKSVQFYSTLFGENPVKLKEDYAKWMLEDPRLNFAISTRSEEVGVNHLGIQVENVEELLKITDRLKNAGLQVGDEGETKCCYAKSNKAWISDPTGLPWETYQNIADIDAYGERVELESNNEGASSCCVPDSEVSSCCG